MANFFIQRPIFSWVIAIVIMLAGALALRTLPVNQYPSIAPPAIQISGVYPGASAQTVQDTVIQVIEQQLNGLDNLRYISSAGNSDGSFTTTVTFNQGTDPDIAQVQVQNKLSLAEPLLPNEVKSQGIRVVKFKVNFLLVVGLVSTDGSMSAFDLGDFIVSSLQDPLSRTSGVGDFLVLGSQNAMRIWLDPTKLYSFDLTPLDISNAIQSQNVQVSSGQLGGLPTREGVQIYATVIGKTRFQTAEQFENILVKVNPNGSQVRLKDVASVELGAENFSISSQYGKDQPSAGIALRLASGANALDTIAAVRETITELEQTFPEGLKVVYPYDTGPFVSESISGVVKTLIEAILLVFLVMYLFLQNFRVTLIPTLAVPVVLLGTFGIMAALGFSVNILTMFGLVLAIGLLVDDAIVVVENVERLMVEENLTPKEATIKSMQQITGALVGIGLVLSAVFVPMAFFGGSTGVIYRQFSVTIVSAMTLSVIVAIIFTPALCATILKPIDQSHHEKTGFFGAFNRWFDRITKRYRFRVERVVGKPKRGMVAFVFIVLGLVWLFPQMPTSFLPDEDQGTIFVQVQLPPNSSAERTEEVLSEVSAYLLEEEGDSVQEVMTVTGFNFAGRSQSSGMAFVSLKHWNDRSSSAFELANRAMGRFSQIKEANVLAIVPPAVMELGTATGFNFFLENRGNLTHEELMNARNQMLGMASQNPKLTLVRPNGMNDEPQFQLTIDDEKVQAYGLTVADVNNTMSAAWGSMYVNDFIDNGRVKKVFLQGIPESRIHESDFNKWFVRNRNGEMVSFNAFATGEWIYGSPKLERYNGVAAVEILGTPARGYSSGEAMEEIEKMASSLPNGVRLAWTGLSFEERMTGSQAPALYALSLLIVFLCLAALYESWSIPFSVMLAVPLGVIGAVGATLLRGLGNDVFFQVGLLTTIGLSAKNAILIVEFARELVEQHGRSIVSAAVEAARLRLRPIIMTSLAFTAGVIPLAISSGASSASKHAVGTGVIGGMLTATILTIFFVPLFFVFVSSFTQKKPTRLEASLNNKVEEQ
jgi:multidrug efflux pump